MFCRYPNRLLQAKRSRITSIHEQVRFPMIVDVTYKVSDEHYMVGTNRFTEECHLSLVQSQISLFIIAVDTSRHQILPGVGSSFGFWNDVIYCKCKIRSSAVLASVSVTA
jgi:hypothetical protein